MARVSFTKPLAKTTATPAKSSPAKSAPQAPKALLGVQVRG